MKKLFNPFIYFAGTKALFFGIITVVLTAITGYLSNTHFPDLISVKSCQEFSFLYHLTQNILNVLVIVFLMYISGLIFSKSKIRLVDFLGTISLARFPYFLAALIGFSQSLRDFGQYLQWKLMNEGTPIQINAITTIIAISAILITLLCTIWFMVLLFNAFKVSANLKGIKLVILFIVNAIIAIVITSLLNNELINIIK